MALNARLRMQISGTRAGNGLKCKPGYVCSGFTARENFQLLIGGEQVGFGT